MKFGTRKEESTYETRKEESIDKKAEASTAPILSFAAHAGVMNHRQISNLKNTEVASFVKAIG